MTKEAVIKYRSWRDEHPDFPLTVHPSGRWSKKIRGRVFYFGPLANHDAALRLWLAEKDYLLAGVDPPSHAAGITVEQLFEVHLKDVEERIAAGKLASKTRRDYQRLPAIFKKAAIVGYPVNALGPQHFAAVQRVLEKSKRTLRTQKNVIMATKAVCT